MYDEDRNWNKSSRLDCTNWPKDGLSEDSYPYQEQVLYRAWCQPDVDDFNLPSIGQFPLPDDDLFADSSVPTGDILIFDVQAFPESCPNVGATFQYTLDTSQSVNTRIIIRDNKPWAGGNTVKTLALNVNQWDGTNNAGQPVPEGEYWFTVEVKNSSNELIGLQSGPVRVGCQKIYLPLIFKNYGSSGLPGGCYVGRVLSDDTFEGGGSEVPFIDDGK